MTPEQMSSEQLEKFLAYYRKRIDDEPDNVEARLRLATVYRQMDKTPRAVAEYEQAARILNDEGLALEAIEACKAILELESEKVEARYLLARLYAQTPDATDGSARVAEPVGDEQEMYELTDEADPRREELIETDEFRPETEDGEPLSRPDPEESDPRAEDEATRVVDYGESPGNVTAGQGTDGGSDEGNRTVELTPEEQERRDGFSREEMEELLTTIDVNSEDIVEVEDLEEYELDDEGDESGRDERATVDLELGAELEVDESRERDS
jgi:tetratricopeptide (TPR) repeat protein